MKSKKKTSFRSELENAGLSQLDLSLLLGIHQSTVNRWCSERDDALPVPKYARVCVKAYALLRRKDRAELASA